LGDVGGVTFLNPMGRSSSIVSRINFDGVLIVWTVFFIKKLSQKINKSPRVYAGESRFYRYGVIDRIYEATDDRIYDATF
jgi:hypothetical protein